MFIIKEDKTRSINEGQYFVELTRNRGLEISNCDRLGYWCDKAHLEHFYDELNKVFSAEEQPKEENQDIITFKGKEYEFIECDYLSCCDNCDLAEAGYCTLSPRICRSDNRRDRREGYFKLIKQKEGELIPYEFYYTEEDNYSWVIQFKGFIVDDNAPISFYYMLKIHDNTLNYNWKCMNNGWVKAIPAQKQQLIDKVQEETGKVWNEDTKTFEDKAKEIIVPENIKIIKYQNDQLGLVFNNNKQVLTFESGVYLVQPLDKLDKFISCRLEKTIFEKLHEGDIFFDEDSIDSIKTLLFYSMKIKSDRYVYIEEDDNIRHDNCAINNNNNYNERNRVYKLIPIK